MYLILFFKNMLTIEDQIDYGRKRQKVDDETPPSTEVGTHAQLEKVERKRAFHG